MKTIHHVIGAFAVTFVLCALISGPVAAAEEIRDEKKCTQVMEDTAQAIDENPELEGKSEKILLEVMELAKQRCAEKNFSAAKDLLELARGMVASE